MPTATQRALQALQLMDLTSLNDTDTDAAIQALCEKAVSPAGLPAAVCVYPAFIDTARKHLLANQASEVRVATVTNFPDGSSDVERAVRETRSAVAAGVHEVDVVLPYHTLMEGDSETPLQLVKACKAACGESVLLKVIIESGELKRPELIRQASDLAIAGGADFIKTSTGKVPVNATLEAAEIMLQAIKDSGKDVGFKAAGGIKTAAEATAYLELAERIFDANWPTAEHFRFGASSLLDNLLTELGHNTTNAHQGSTY